jgi:quinolinate synthase
MKLITIEKIYNCLKNEKPEIKLNEKLITAAQKPIKRMLEISGKTGN